MPKLPLYKTPPQKISPARILWQFTLCSSPPRLSFLLIPNIGQATYPWSIKSHTKHHTLYSLQRLYPAFFHLQIPVQPILQNIVAKVASANDAALYDARRRIIGSSSQMLDSIIQGSNCKDRDERTLVGILLTLLQKSTATRWTGYGSDLWS